MISVVFVLEKWPQRVKFLALKNHLGKFMYISLLTQIKNAQQLNKPSLKVPYTTMDEAILNLLKEKKFISNVEKKGRSPRRILEITLAYEHGEGKIQGFKFISKPSRRMYKKYTELYPVRNTYGMSILSTSKGIMTHEEARKEKVGGQVLFEIW